VDVGGSNPSVPTILVMNKNEHPTNSTPEGPGAPPHELPWNPLVARFNRLVEMGKRLGPLALESVISLFKEDTAQTDNVIYLSDYKERNKR
jgi:hypothetical protein